MYCITGKLFLCYQITGSEKEKKSSADLFSSKWYVLWLRFGRNHPVLFWRSESHRCWLTYLYTHLLMWEGRGGEGGGREGVCLIKPSVMVVRLCALHEPAGIRSESKYSHHLNSGGSCWLNDSPQAICV